MLGQIRGVFIMGGVLADAAPMTMPSLPNVLNRFSRYPIVKELILFAQALT